MSELKFVSESSISQLSVNIGSASTNNSSIQCALVQEKQAETKNDIMNQNKTTFNVIHQNVQNIVNKKY